MSNKKAKQTSSKSISNEIETNEIETTEEKQVTEEEKKNNRFSFMVGIFIAMAIIIVFTIVFR